MSAYLNIIVPLVQEGMRRGVVTLKAPWLPQSTEVAVRFATVLDGDIPALVEIEPSRSGLQSLSWALWPHSPEVVFPGLMDANTWPGEVWGSATIDRRILYDFRLSEDGRFHSRRAKGERLLALPECAIADFPQPWAVAA